MNDTHREEQELSGPGPSDVVEEVIKPLEICARRNWSLTLSQNQTKVLLSEITRLREENYRLIIQLAGCSVAALGHDDNLSKGAYGWSPAYQDVLGLRAENERLRKILTDPEIMSPASLRRATQALHDSSDNDDGDP